MTGLHNNPFAILGASMRDDRRKLIELAEARALEGDQEAIQKSRAQLTNPRARLEAEIAWVPGMSPKRAAQLLEILSANPRSLLGIKGIPPLANANILGATLESEKCQLSSDEVASQALALALAFEELDPDQILRDLNEDRGVAGISPVAGTELVAEMLGERKRYFVRAARAAFDRLPSSSLVSAFTKMVDDATGNGDREAPQLIDELVDGYSLEVQDFLSEEGEKVRQILAAIRKEASSKNKPGLKKLTEQLGSTVRNWDLVAQPIQVSAKSRGKRDETSRTLALEIRSVGVELCNEHNLLEPAQEMTALLQDVFAEVPEVFEKLEEDAEALAGLVESRDEQAAAITYEADVGALFKSKLKISPDGIEWKGSRRALESITRVRWGGVRHSVNGIPTGTTYTIAYGDNSSETSIELRREETYTQFLERLWPAVCARLAHQIVQTLGAGKTFRVGDALLRDDGVELERHKFFSNERVFCNWRDIHVWSADGSFFIGARADKKVYVQASYIEVANVHVVEFLIRAFFKKPASRLSQAFA